MKKSITLLLVFCGLVVTTASAQFIIQSVVPDFGVWGPVNNTGIAIAPGKQWNVIAYDDPSTGNYYLQWREPNSGAFLDIEDEPGRNPDVAYYSNPDAVVVTYEDGGDIWADSYYLTAGVDYTLFTKDKIDPGTNSNVDMNSKGDGVLVWQNGFDIYACTFTIGPFTPGPVTYIGWGDTPDIALLDDNSNVVITYVVSPELVVETFDFNDLSMGTATMTTSNWYPPSGMGFEHPRVQSNRNANFGAADLYTVVAQDNLGGSQYLIHGFFYTSLGFSIQEKINPPLEGCGTPNPLPVVAYDRKEVHIAWAQRYNLGCSGINPVDLGRDVLLAECDFGGINVNGPGVFLEVNNINANFANSATSINTEYDGDYSINNLNYCEGLAYDYPGDLLWKTRDATTPFFRTSGPDKFTVKVDKGVSSNWITVEVASDDESITEADLEMTFALYDQSGRVVDVTTFEQEGMVYRIDATSLEHGIYLLHYTLNGETKAERIPHFVN
jgi:hypothetical protein